VENASLCQHHKTDRNKGKCLDEADHNKEDHNKEEACEEDPRTGVVVWLMMKRRPHSMI